MQCFPVTCTLTTCWQQGGVGEKTSLAEWKSKSEALDFLVKYRIMGLGSMKANLQNGASVDECMEGDSNFGKQRKHGNAIGKSNV